MHTGEIGQLLVDLVKGVSGVKPVQLSPGQVVSVRIKKIVGETALLSFQGQEIVARLETEVSLGQELRCLVEGVKNGQVVLKVLNPNQEVMNSGVLLSILRNLDLQDTEVNRAIIGQLIEMEMPINHETVRQLSLFMNTQKLPVQDVWIPAFMKNQGLPLTTEMLGIVKGILTDMKFLHAALDKLLAAAAKEANNPQVQGELKQIFYELSQSIRDLQLSSADPPETMALKLAGVFRQLVSPDGAGTGQVRGQVPIAQQGQGRLPGQGTAVSMAQPGKAEAIPAQTGQTAPVHGQPNQAAAIQARPNQAAAFQVQPNQAAALQAQPNQAVALQAQPNQAVALQAQPNQAVALQAQPNQAVALQAQPNQAAALQAQPNQAAALSSQSIQAAVNHPEAAHAGSPINLASESVIPETRLGAAGGSVSEPAVDEGEIISNIVKRLGEAAQKAPGLDDAGREQFMARLNVLLDRPGDNISPKPDLLLLLGKMIEGLRGNTNHESIELLKLAQNVMDKLETLHSFNNKTEPGRENIMVMYSSVRFEDIDEPLSLFINYRYDGQKNRRDFNSCRVEVKLETPNLSQVRCEVQVNYKNLHLQFICDNEKAGQLIEKMKDSFLEKLRQMNYQVTSSATRVEATEGIEGAWFQPKTERPGLFTLNLRV
ncbi:MAG: hypothetical protein ROZ36_06835 [Thermincola sp.]|nr:hypothetical protein [Thermincola sp.]